MSSRLKVFILLPSLPTFQYMRDPAEGIQLLKLKAVACIGRAGKDWMHRKVSQTEVYVLTLWLMGQYEVQNFGILVFCDICYPGNTAHKLQQHNFLKKNCLFYNFFSIHSFQYGIPVSSLLDIFWMFAVIYIRIIQISFLKIQYFYLGCRILIVIFHAGF